MTIETAPAPDPFEHDCVLVSGCCQASPAFELDAYLTGHCSKCHEIAGFECEEYEDCPTAPWT